MLAEWFGATENVSVVKMGKKTEEQLNALIALVKYSEKSYWCEWCKRHLPMEDGIFIHDDVYHPSNWTPDCGNEHKLQ